MNSICLLIREELKSTARNTVKIILLNLMGTFFLYVAFIAGLGLLLPRINFTDISQYMFPGVVSFFVAIFSFGLSSFNVHKMINASGLMVQLRTTALNPFQIHLGKSLSFVLKGLVNAILSGLFLLVLTGFFVQVEYLVLYFVFITIGIVFVVQLGIIFGTIVKKQTFLIYILLFIVIPLFLLSGMITPSNYYPGIAKQIIYYLPSTAIIEGGRELLLNHSFNNLYIIYIIVLDVITFIVAFFVFRRNLER